MTSLHPLFCKTTIIVIGNEDVLKQVGTYIHDNFKERRCIIIAVNEDSLSKEHFCDIYMDVNTPCYMVLHEGSIALLSSLVDVTTLQQLENFVYKEIDQAITDLERETFTPSVQQRGTLHQRTNSLQLNDTNTRSIAGDTQITVKIVQSGQSPIYGVFHPDDEISMLFRLIHLHIDKNKRFNIVTSYPRRVLTEHHQTQTFRDLKFSQSETVHLKSHSGRNEKRLSQQRSSNIDEGEDSVAARLYHTVLGILSTLVLAPIRIAVNFLNDHIGHYLYNRIVQHTNEPLENPRNRNRRQSNNVHTLHSDSEED